MRGCGGCFNSGESARSDGLCENDPYGHPYPYPYPDPLLHSHAKNSPSAERTTEGECAGNGNGKGSFSLRVSGVCGRLPETAAPAPDRR
jgi:hypothetical protein